MGTYTSKYTGEQVDNLLGKVENGEAGGGSASKPRAFLYKKLSSIGSNTSFDMDIITNRGFEVSGDNRIVLKANTTYLIFHAIVAATTGSSSSGELQTYIDIAELDYTETQIAMYPNGRGIQHGWTGDRYFVYTPTADVELKFITSKYTAGVQSAEVNCVVEEF